MPRPSLKEERREQILAAYERCVARFGVDGATLEKTAEEAGLARALIRHNVGNREALQAALTDRFLARSQAAVTAILDALPKQKRLQRLIEGLFDPDHEDQQLMLVSEALIAASAEDPALAGTMRQWATDFVKALERVVRLDYPTTDKATTAAVAAGLAGIYFNVESLTPLGSMPGLRKASKGAALLLVKALERQS